MMLGRDGGKGSKALVSRTYGRINSSYVRSAPDSLIFIYAS